MATQFFFTICFVGMLIAIALVLMYLLCIDDYYRVKVLRWIGFDLIVAGRFWRVENKINIYNKFQAPAAQLP